MSLSDTEYISKTFIYKMRVTPILSRILKKMNIVLNDELIEKIVTFMHSKLPLNDLTKCH